MGSLHTLAGVYRSVACAVTVARDAGLLALGDRLLDERHKLEDLMGDAAVAEARRRFGLDGGEELVPVAVRPSIGAFATELERRLADAEVEPRAERLEMDADDFIANGIEYLQAALDEQDAEGVWDAALQCVFALDAVEELDADGSLE